MKIILRFHTAPWLAALCLSALWLGTNILPAEAQTPLQRSLVGTAGSEPSGESAAPQASEQDLQELVRLLSNPGSCTNSSAKSSLKEGGHGMPGD